MAMTNPIRAVQNFRVTVSSGSHSQTVPAAVSIADHIGELLGVGENDVIDDAAVTVQPCPVLDARRLVISPRQSSVAGLCGGMVG
jgi:hypothetical protein